MKTKTTQKQEIETLASAGFNGLVIQTKNGKRQPNGHKIITVSITPIKSGNAYDPVTLKIQSNATAGVEIEVNEYLAKYKIASLGSPLMLENPVIWDAVNSNASRLFL